MLCMVCSYKCCLMSIHLSHELEGACFFVTKLKWLLFNFVYNSLNRKLREGCPSPTNMAKISICYI